jgi:hypothetical protein
VIKIKLLDISGSMEDTIKYEEKCGSRIDLLKGVLLNELDADELASDWILLTFNHEC